MRHVLRIVTISISGGDVKGSMVGIPSTAILVQDPALLKRNDAIPSSACGGFHTATPGRGQANSCRQTDLAKVGGALSA